MPKKSKRIETQNTLDLHDFRSQIGIDLESSLFIILDRFLTPRMTQKNIKITIIVGKGLGSKKFIEGKNPLRYYTEKYLMAIGCDWQDGDYNTGQDGSINVYL